MIHERSEIPVFTSEREAADYWASHTFSDKLLESFGSPPPEWMNRIRRTPRDSWVRIDDATANRLTLLASRRNCPREQLVEEFLSERLTQEELVESLSGVGE